MPIIRRSKMLRNLPVGTEDTVEYEQSASGNTIPVAGAKQCTEHNLKLVEERTALLLKELEIECAAKLERRKQQLEEEVRKVREEILRAGCDSTDSNRDGVNNFGRIGEWTQRVNQVASSSRRAFDAAGRMVTIPSANLETVPPFPTVGSAPSLQATVNNAFIPVPAVHTSRECSYSSGAQVVFPSASNAFQPAAIRVRSNNPPTSVQAAGLGPSLFGDSLPGSEANRPGFSTPVTSSPTMMEVTRCSSSQQCLSAANNSMGLGHLGNPTTVQSVSQRYQVTTSQSNSSRSELYTISSNVSVGPERGLVSPYANQIKNNLFAPSAPPQFDPRFCQVPSVSLSIPLVSKNSEKSVSTTRQLTVKHEILKDLPSFSGGPEKWPVFYSALCTTTEASGCSEAENLVRLQRCLEGSALEAVYSQFSLPSAVPQVMETWQLLRGHPEQTTSDKVREILAPEADSLMTLVTDNAAVQNACDQIVVVNVTLTVESGGSEDGSEEESKEIVNAQSAMPEVPKPVESESEQSREGSLLFVDRKEGDRWEAVYHEPSTTGTLDVKDDARRLRLSRTRNSEDFQEGQMGEPITTKTGIGPGRSEKQNFNYTSHNGHENDAKLQDSVKLYLPTAKSNPDESVRRRMPYCHPQVLILVEKEVSNWVFGQQMKIGQRNTGKGLRRVGATDGCRKIIIDCRLMEKSSEMQNRVKLRDRRVSQESIDNQEISLRWPVMKIMVLEIQIMSKVQESFGNTGEPGSVNQHYGSGDVADGIADNIACLPHPVGRCSVIRPLVRFPADPSPRGT